MKDKRIEIVFAILVLVAGGALEELLPKYCGVGFPILLAATLYRASRLPMPFALGFAAVAAALEESLSALPFMTAIAFFMSFGLLARYTRVPQLAMLVSYPVYQVWLRAWIPELAGGIFSRFLLAVPIGILTMLVTVPLLAYLERKAALDEHA